MSKSSTTGSSSRLPGNLSDIYGEPSDSWLTHINDLLISQPLLESKLSVSFRTRSRVEVINPFEGEIVVRHPSFSHEVNSSNLINRDANMINLSSNSDEDKTISNDPLTDSNGGFWNESEQPFLITIVEQG